MGRKMKNPLMRFREVVTHVEALRKTPYGRSGGALRNFSAMELGAMAIKSLAAHRGQSGPVGC